MTFREGQRQGDHIRKGERATPVIYWTWRTPEELAQHAEQTGKEDMAPCMPFVSGVFNFDPVEGVTRPDDDLEGVSGYGSIIQRAVPQIVTYWPRAGTAHANG